MEIANIQIDTKYDPKFLERFFNKVEKTESCWFWHGAIQSKGYGSIGLDGKILLAHRVAFEIFNGPIPQGLLACHHCDNRNCVNPSHLFLGTIQDNVDDMINKNRQAKAEQNGNAKLNRFQVTEIRVLHPQYTFRELGENFGVSTRQIRSIINDEYWKIP